MTYLIYGARRGSLGDYIAKNLLSLGLVVVTAGISHEEDLTCDILDGEERVKMLESVEPSNIVCTVGINKPVNFFHDEWSEVFADSVAVNTFGPLALLRDWVARTATDEDQFVAISSNSAQIARTGSSPYCMSKAALSMGIRCVARELAKQSPAGDYPQVYAWEFGLLDGSPMTQEVDSVLGANTLTRMPGLPAGMPVSSAADAVTSLLLMHGAKGLNGSVFRMDAGEQ
jgi:NAD(P)-dependent dehydrogenase (short-subunit alcohol dehydrogenase family)